MIFRTFLASFNLHISGILGLLFFLRHNLMDADLLKVHIEAATSWFDLFLVQPSWSPELPQGLSKELVQPEVAFLFIKVRISLIIAWM